LSKQKKKKKKKKKEEALTGSRDFHFNLSKSLTGQTLIGQEIFLTKEDLRELLPVAAAGIGVARDGNG
jgi:hypothetical protein